MACRISELVIDAADPDRLAAFWSKVLGYVELGREDDGSIEIGPPGAGARRPDLITGRCLPPTAKDRWPGLPGHHEAAGTATRGRAGLARWFGIYLR